MTGLFFHIKHHIYILAPVVCEFYTFHHFSIYILVPVNFSTSSKMFYEISPAVELLPRQTKFPVPTLPYRQKVNMSFLRFRTKVNTSFLYCRYAFCLALPDTFSTTSMRSYISCTRKWTRWNENIFRKRCASLLQRSPFHIWPKNDCRNPLMMSHPKMSRKS